MTETQFIFPIIKKNSEPFQKNNIVINEPVKEQEGGNMDDLKQQIMKIYG